MNSSPPIRVLLLDVNAELSEYLANAPRDIVLVGAGSSAQGFERFAPLKPDIVVLEVFVPDSSAIDTIRIIRTFMPPARAFILSARADISFARSALSAGATAFVLKTDDKADLVASLRAAYRGRIVLSPVIAYALIQSGSVT